MKEMQKGTTQWFSNTTVVSSHSAVWTLLFIGVVESKVSKGKHRGKKQEKEETESAAEPEGEPGNHVRLWLATAGTENCRSENNFLVDILTVPEQAEEIEDQG